MDYTNGLLSNEDRIAELEAQLENRKSFVRRAAELEGLLNEANKLIMEHCDQDDRIAALEQELAAITHIAMTADPAGWWIAPRGSSDPSEWICVEEMDDEAENAALREDKARWRSAHVELCAAIARMPTDVRWRDRHFSTDETHRGPLIDLFYRQRADIDAKEE